MAIAETAHLITQLDLRNNLSPGLAKARGDLSAANAASSGLAGGLSKLGGVSGAVGSAFSTLKTRVGQLAGAAGFLGLGAGLFSVGALFEKGISQATEFGNEVYKLQAVTGLSAQKTSELAAVFHHFGIESDTALRIAALGEKNLFAQGETAKKAAAFYTTYGFALRDASGHLKDFNTLLLEEADYFNNKAIPAATKDAELAKIFGRNWQSLIPVLAAGRGAIQDAEEEAQKLGLTLTSSNLSALAKLRQATRDWGTALGGLELQIGLVAIPAITKLATAATHFLASGGRQAIVGFFQGILNFGQQAADVIVHQVVPAIGAVYSFWNKIPPDVRNFLIRGLVADRTIKFLLGFSPIGLGLKIAEGMLAPLARGLGGALTGGIGGLFGKFIGSKAIPQLVEAAAPIPVFVTNPGFGLPGGGR